MMFNTMICIIALTELFPINAGVGYTEKVGESYLDRLGVCVNVANVAEELNVPPSIAVAISYQETKFDDSLTGKRGELGAMQILPQYACPKGKRDCPVCDNATGVCDWVRASVIALKRWLRLHPRDYACHYNAGNTCNTRSKRYQRSVKRRRARITTQVEAMSFDFANYERLLVSQ